jgi:hypothetical protein
VRFHGLDGQPFSAIKNVAYAMSYTNDAAPPDPGSAPYLRIYMTDPSDAANTLHDAIFTPGSQAYKGLGPGPIQEFVATQGTWRFDSDDGSNSEFGNGVPLSQVLAKYGSYVISRIAVTLGATSGQNLAGLLRRLEINGVTYVFAGS